LDVLAQPLSFVTDQLDKKNLRYIVKVTRPTRDFFKVDENCLYVIRQHIDADGIYCLVAAAKMGKEVF